MKRDLQKRLTCMNRRPGDSVFLLETQVHMDKKAEERPTKGFSVYEKRPTYDE